MVRYNIQPHPELINWLSSIQVGVGPTWPEQFVLGPDQQLPIHVDGDRFDNKTKLNFVTGGKHSYMAWYRPKTDSSHTIKHTPIGTKYLVPVSRDAVECVAKAEIIGACLVNVGLFHNVENFTETRRTVSIPLIDLESGDPLDWDQAMERFAPWIVISNR